MHHYTVTCTWCTATDMSFSWHFHLWLHRKLSFWELCITLTSKWPRWRLKSPASRLFTQPFIQMQMKENIKAPRHWPLCGEFTGTGEFPAQRASYAEYVSIWWRHHGVQPKRAFRQNNHIFVSLSRDGVVSPEQNGHHFADYISKSIFLDKNVIISLILFPQVLRTKIGIGSGNGLVPNRRQAIAWTTLDPRRHMASLWHNGSDVRI